MSLETVRVQLPAWKTEREHLLQYLKDIKTAAAWAAWGAEWNAHNTILRLAFYEDTKHINSKTHCLLADIPGIIAQAEKETTFHELHR